MQNYIIFSLDFYERFLWKGPGAGAGCGVGGGVAGVCDVGAVVGDAAPAGGEGDDAAGAEPGSAGPQRRPAPARALLCRQAGPVIPGAGDARGIRETDDIKQTERLL